MNQKVEFKIDGMHCNSCAALIEDELKDTAGVQSAKASFDDKNATVEFDDEVVQQATLIKKIQELGYQPTVSRSTTSVM